MLKFNYLKFIDLHKISDIEMAEQLNISRTQIWRAKKGSNVGEKFISSFKGAFPLLSTDDYFF